MEVNERRLLPLIEEKSTTGADASIEPSHSSEEHHSLHLLSKGLRSSPIVAPRPETEARRVSQEDRRHHRPKEQDPVIAKRTRRQYTL